MARRAAHTLVFIGVNRIDRIDFGPGPDFAVLGAKHQAALANEEPEILLESVLVGGARVGKSVWVLWEGATAIMLDMSSGVVVGLEKNQLADALSFEAEPLTGLPATESAIGGVSQRATKDLLPDTKRYWVTQIPAVVRDKLDEAVTRTGAKLLGIAHPGGLPRAHWGESAEAERAIDWRRVEIWQDLTFSLHGRPDGTTETRVIRSSPGSEKWASDLPSEGPVSWMGPGPVTRVGPDGRRVTDSLTLLSGDGSPLETEKIDLARDKGPMEWLRAWIEELSSTSRRVPVVERFTNASPNRKFYVAGGVLAGLALAACIVHGEVVGYQTAATNTRAVQLEALRAQMTPIDKSKQDESETQALAEKLKGQLTDLDTQLQQLQEQASDLDKKQAEIAERRNRVLYLQTIQRPALAMLLDAVAKVEDDPQAEVVIKDIRQSPDGGSLVLTGLSKHATEVNAFAVELQTQLTLKEWKVGAAQKKLRGDLQAFDFTLNLTPASMLGFDSGVADPNEVDQPGADQNAVGSQTAPPPVDPPVHLKASRADDDSAMPKLGNGANGGISANVQTVSGRDHS
jgi:Tfp pilus assembly protein PilN